MVLSDHKAGTHSPKARPLAVQLLSQAAKIHIRPQMGKTLPTPKRLIFNLSRPKIPKWGKF
ncbi:hypothetical protein EI77_03324 [Prosthecobacter fusiformis]|uniref:Uncharacterized protein n=1 Tax=Prosthecobacter fusiformis TaxID=48464 RepID=A0A4R7RUT6_9BACT|nr:hypothetical protein EI77_03324 [Prosthecobacter fusiformis]